MAELSATAFAKAMAKASSKREQNQIMEMVNTDIVDMVEQILALEHPQVPRAKCTLQQPRDVHDVQKLITSAAFRLRVILELLDGSNNRE